MKYFRLTGVLAVVALVVSCGTGVKKYDATGTFEATEIVVSAEAMGKLIDFDVTEGSWLSAGQQVGLIDTVQPVLAVGQLMLSALALIDQVPDLNKQIAVSKRQIVSAQREKQRIVNLLAAGAATTKQLDDADDQIAILNRQLQAQLSALGKSTESLNKQSEALRLQAKQATDLLTKCYISSPITGTVLAKYAEKGELAVVGKPLFKLANLDDIYLRAYITSSQLDQLKLGDKVTVYADYGTKTSQAYEGTVTWISAHSEFTPKTILTQDERANLVYAIKIAVRNDGHLKIGMYGGVKLHG